MEELKYANKLLRKVKLWKKGKRTLVDSGAQAKNMEGFRMPARDVWGDPNAKISTGKPAS
jgi:hypothetical protein